MIRRRDCLSALAVAALAAQTDARAQPGPKLRIGWLAATPTGPFFQDFRQALQEIGYAARDTVIEERYGDAAILPALVDELVRAKVSVIVAAGTAAGLAAKRATVVIPIVSVSGNPVGVGLVDSLAHPGGNITGLSIVSADIDVKWIELLKGLLPKLLRVAILRDGSPATAPVRARFEAAAASLGVELMNVEARSPAELDQAFALAARERVGGIVVASSGLFAGQAAGIVHLAAKHRLPAIYEHGLFVEAGGLMSYGPDLHGVFRRAAAYVDKILKGAAPATLPIEQPTRFELLLNAKTAKALGITIPQALLLRVDKVIE